jgi:hypothetical protein
LVESSASSLTALADQLRELVGQFRIPGSQPARPVNSAAKREVNSSRPLANLVVH